VVVEESNGGYWEDKGSPPRLISTQLYTRELVHDGDCSGIDRIFPSAQNYHIITQNKSFPIGGVIIW